MVYLLSQLMIFNLLGKISLILKNYCNLNNIDPLGKGTYFQPNRKCLPLYLKSRNLQKSSEFCPFFSGYLRGVWAYLPFPV